MLDWPMSSPQMMTMLGFCCCAAAGTQASAAAKSGATTNEVVRASFTGTSCQLTKLVRHLILSLSQEVKQALLTTASMEGRQCPLWVRRVGGRHPRHVGLASE